MTSLFGQGSMLNASGTLVPQQFTPTDGQTVFILTAFSYTPNSNTLLVFVNGQKQRIGADYIESSSTTFTLLEAVSSTDSVEVIGFPLATISTVVVPDGGVSTSKIQDGAVTAAKFASGAVAAAIGTGTITSANIADGAIQTIDIADKAVTLAKLNTTGTATGTKVLKDDLSLVEPRTLGGSVTVTLTSAAPNATLTSTSAQYVIITNDTTVPVAPSVTLPAMNSGMVTGVGYFNFSNTTPYIVALKDSGGVVREYIAPGANYSLNIKDISTATGQWNIAFPANVVSTDQTLINVIANSFRVNATWIITGAQLIKMDATDFVLVWNEWNNAAISNIYVKPFAVNVSTKVVTPGTTVLAAALNATAGATNYISSTTNFYYDIDNAGHALIAFCGLSNYSAPYNTSVAGYFGISLSGGALAASALTVQNYVGNLVACNPVYYGQVGTVNYIGYLGSNNAFALSFNANWLNSNGTTGQGGTWIVGCTVTGTSTCTLTNSANNTTLSVSTAAYGSRTDMTTFTLGGSNGTVGRALTYTPASNTFAVNTRTNQARLDIEQASLGQYGSFAQGGFMFSSGKAFFGPNVYDITNAGAVGVTAVVSVGFSYKPNLGSAYSTSTKGNQVTSFASRSSIYVSGTSMVAVDGTIRWQCDPSQTTLNLQRSNGISNYSGQTLLLDTATPVTWNASNVGSAGSSGTMTVVIGNIGTPITL